MQGTDKGKHRHALPVLRCCDVGHGVMVSLFRVGQTKHWVIAVHLHQHNSSRELLCLHWALLSAQSNEVKSTTEQSQSTYRITVTDWLPAQTMDAELDMSSLMDNHLTTSSQGTEKMW